MVTFVPSGFFPWIPSHTVTLASSSKLSLSLIDTCTHTYGNRPVTAQEKSDVLFNDPPFVIKPQQR